MDPQQGTTTGATPSGDEKDKQYKAQIQQFFKAPLSDPAPMEAVTLTPEPATVSATEQGEPLFVEEQTVTPTLAKDTKAESAFSFADFAEEVAKDAVVIPPVEEYHDPEGAWTPEVPPVMMEESGGKATTVIEESPTVLHEPVVLEPMKEEKQEVPKETTPTIEEKEAALPAEREQPRMPDFSKEEEEKSTVLEEVVTQSPPIEETKEEELAAPVVVEVMEDPVEIMPKEEVMSVAPVFAPEEQLAPQEGDGFQGYMQLCASFGAVDPQKALEKREYTPKEMQEGENAYHAYVEHHRSATVDMEDSNQEFAMFLEVWLLEEMASTWKNGTGSVEGLEQDFFLYQDPRSIRFLLEYAIGRSSTAGQIEYFPYIDYRVQVKRPLLVYVLWECLFSLFPTERTAFFMTMQDEIYQDRKKYIRVSMECAPLSAFQEKYQQMQPLLTAVLEQLRGRMGVRMEEGRLRLVVDLPFTVQKED